MLGSAGDFVCAACLAPAVTIAVGARPDQARLGDMEAAAGLDPDTGRSEFVPAPKLG